MTHINSLRPPKDLALSRKVINMRAFCRTAQIKFNVVSRTAIIPSIFPEMSAN
jgi:hypothetical protein